LHQYPEERGTRAADASDGPEELLAD
jgi:hypothetical protein